MQENFTIDALVAGFAKRIAAQVRAELAEDAAATLKPRLLTIEQAATYMGRTDEAMQHMVATGKVPTVRIDRRVFVDVRDLENLIENNKTATTR